MINKSELKIYLISLCFMFFAYTVLMYNISDNDIQIKYEIEFVDIDTGKQIEDTIVGYGIQNQKISCYPMQIENYVTDAKTAIMVLKEGEGNKIIFSYRKIKDSNNRKENNIVIIKEQDIPR